MNTEPLTEQHLEILSLKGDCTGSSASIHVKIPHCWKSHVAAHIIRKYIVHNFVVVGSFLPSFWFALGCFFFLK